MVRNAALAAGLGLALAAGAWAQTAAPPAAPGQPGGAQARTESSAAESTTRASGRRPTRRDREEAQKLFVEGAKDVQQDKLRAAIQAFVRAAELNPEERQYAAADQIARAHLVEELIQQSDKDKILGHPAQAKAKVAEAYAVDPASPEVVEHMNELASDAVAGEPATRSESVALAPPIALEPKSGRRSFHLRAGVRTLIPQVLNAYGIQATLDDSVGAQTVRYDVDDADFATAEQTLELATGTFAVPLDPARALIARDSRANREKYERQATETVYLPGMASDELTEITTIAKNVFALRTATADISHGALTVRGPASDLEALNTTLKSLLEGRSELQVDVRIYEIDRTKAVNLGMILPNQTTVFNVYSEARNLLNANASTVQEIVSSGLAAPGDWEAILAILIASGQISNSILSQPFGYFGGGLTMTGVVYQGGSLNMQLNSSDVRAIDQMQLRVLNREESTLKIGERYPIETSSFSSLGATTNLNIPGLSTAGLSSTLSSLGLTAAQLQASETATIPQVQYQDIGLTLKVQPTIQGTNRVSLKLDLTLSSLGGSSLNGLPLLNNREYNAITSVKTGETSILVSALTRQESNAVTGIPGLSEIPGFQSTTNKDTNLDVGELAIVITPHIVRAVHREASEKMIMLPEVKNTGP